MDEIFEDSILFDDSGEIDDIAIYNPELVRLEKMSDGQWWMRIYSKDKDIIINVTGELSSDIEYRYD